MKIIIAYSGLESIKNNNEVKNAHKTVEKIIILLRRKDPSASAPIKGELIATKIAVAEMDKDHQVVPSVSFAAMVVVKKAL